MIPKLVNGFYSW